jgi:hypothetical protein
LIIQIFFTFTKFMILVKKIELSSFLLPSSGARFHAIHEEHDKARGEKRTHVHGFTRVRL